MMRKRFGLLLLLAAVIAAPGMAQTEKIFLEGFEANDATMTGGSVTSSMTEEVANEKVASIEGNWALYVEYNATSSTNWSQAVFTFPEPQDIKGVSEIRYSMYFLPGSTTNSNGQVPVRMHLPPDDCYSFDYITPGQWYEVVLPIDPYVSETGMSPFTLFRMVISAGLVGQGSFLLDNIYALRPTNPAKLEIVPLYGLNETNPGTTTPLGWMKDQSANPPQLGADFIEPSEGSNCMLIPVTQNYISAVKTINAKKDIDWTRVRAIYFDACVTSDFTTWCVIRPNIQSTSGGTTLPVQFRGIGGDKTWRTLSFWLDLGPHMASILGNGDFAIGLHHDNGTDANVADAQDILVDNIRVAMVSSFCLAVRSFAENTSFYEGDIATANVDILLTMKGEKSSATVTETLPEGWTATNISHNGKLANGIITWTVDVAPDAPLTLTYTASSPKAISSPPVWSGTVNGDDVYGVENPPYFSQYVKKTIVDAPLLTNQVALDGILSAGEYEGANTYKFDHDTANGNTAPGVHLSGTVYPADQENLSFSVFHDTRYIYVAVDVVDPNLSFEFNDNQFWNADSPEIYFDGNMTRSNSIEGNRYGCQLTVVGDGRLAASNNKYFPAMLDAVGGGKYMLDGRDGADQPIYWACGAKVKDDQSGFVVEYRVDKSVILEPATRTQVGFEVMMNSSDAQNPAVRTGKWGWHCSDPTGAPYEAYNNESGWTLMNLLDGGTSVQDWSLF